MPRQANKPSRQSDMFRPASLPQPPRATTPATSLTLICARSEAHLRERPYDPTSDDYAVEAFDQPIETTKATAIYNMHTYWSKKPHDAIRQYIRHYTRPGDLVLDPFCGSGGTALAALMEGRKAVAIDRSPAATFHYQELLYPRRSGSAARRLRRAPGEGQARDRLALRHPLRRPGHNDLYRLLPSVSVSALPGKGAAV